MLALVEATPEAVRSARKRRQIQYSSPITGFYAINGMGAEQARLPRRAGDVPGGCVIGVLTGFVVPFFQRQDQYMHIVRPIKVTIAHSVRFSSLLCTINCLRRKKTFCEDRPLEAGKILFSIPIMGLKDGFFFFCSASVLRQEGCLAPGKASICPPSAQRVPQHIDDQ
jgi:hypothetical protein